MYAQGEDLHVAALGGDFQIPVARADIQNPGGRGPGLTPDSVQKVVQTGLGVLKGIGIFILEMTPNFRLGVVGYVSHCFSFLFSTFDHQSLAGGEMNDGFLFIGEKGVHRLFGARTG